MSKSKGNSILTEHENFDDFIEDGNMKDIPGISDEKQTVVDENQVNEAFSPVNDAFSGLREAGDWLMNMISEFFADTFGNLM
ncbi:MAG: hypothetical protein ACO3K2_08815 [Nitrosopumilaceae archaeon]